MDLSDRDKYVMDGDVEHNLNFHSSNLPLHWRLSSSNHSEAFPSESASSSSMSMVDTFCPSVWDPSSSHNVAFSEATPHASPCAQQKTPNRLEADSRNFLVEKSLEPSWQPSNLVQGGGFVQGITGIQSHDFSAIPIDSDFIERAARFSCFSASTFSATVNPFTGAESLSPHGHSGQFQLPDILSPNFLGASSATHNENKGLYVKAVHDGACLPTVNEMTIGSPRRNNVESENFLSSSEKHAGGVLTNESDEAFSEEGREPFSKDQNTKKRKRAIQDTDINQCNLPISTETSKENGEFEQRCERSPASAASKPPGILAKESSQNSDTPKEEYIHVRARRGQATNSHSLAERVRREKISERMKLLQDLVPGCNKVTGKAVMLDEIINYVQSLQRQVEFLSMKLAAVNPCLDVNIEGLFTKDILQSRGSPSRTMGLPPDNLPHTQLHLAPQGFIPTGIHLLGSSSEPIRRPLHPQITPLSAYKEATTQLPGVWDNELHNIVQMSFGGSMPYNVQEMSGSHPPGDMKIEL